MDEAEAECLSDDTYTATVDCWQEKSEKRKCSKFVENTASLLIKTKPALPQNRESQSEGRAWVSLRGLEIIAAPAKQRDWGGYGKI